MELQGVPKKNERKQTYLWYLTQWLNKSSAKVLEYVLSKNARCGNYSEYSCSFVTTPLNYFHVEQSSSDSSSFLEGGNFPHI